MVLPPLSFTEWTQFLAKAGEISSRGHSFYEAWYRMAELKPPKNIIGRILWSLGILCQLAISLVTFPAALAVFLQEEGVQAAGMGAYLLAAGKQWDALDQYLDIYKAVLDGNTTAANNLATLQPIVGGSVIAYMGAAYLQYTALRNLTDIKLREQIEKDEEERRRQQEKAHLGDLQLLSSPTNAEIWLDGVNTEKLTPETLKDLEAGEHVIELRKYSVKRGTWDIYTFTITIEPGFKKEVMVRIPPTITSDEESGTTPEEKTTPKYPDFIYAEVEGDYAIDGDTFITTTGEKIRLWGIDAPELDRPYGQEAKEFLQEQIEDKNIRIKIQSDKPLDGYGRTLAECRNYKGNINVMLLSAGLAKTDFFPEDKFDPTRYTAAEKAAQDRKIGIWSEMKS